MAQPEEDDRERAHRLLAEGSALLGAQGGDGPEAIRERAGHARGLLAQAQALFDALPDAVARAADSTRLLGIACLLGGDPRAAVVELAKAAAAYEQLGDERLGAECVTNLGTVLLMLGDAAGAAGVLGPAWARALRAGRLAEAEQLEDRLASAERGAGLADAALRAANRQDVLGRRALDAGDHARAVRSLSAARAGYLELAAAGQAVECGAPLAAALAETGETGPALSLVAEVCAEPQGPRDELRAAAVRTRVGAVLGRLGRHAEAAELHAAAHAALERFGEPADAARSSALLGISLSALGETGRAIAAWTAAQAGLRDAGDLEGQAGAAGLLSGALQSQGREEDAARVLAEALDVCVRAGARTAPTATLEESLGSVLVVLGRPDEATGHLAEAQAIHAELGAWPAAAKAGLLLGRAWRVRHEPDRAIEAFAATEHACRAHDLWEQAHAALAERAMTLVQAERGAEAIPVLEEAESLERERGIVGVQAGRRAMTHALALDLVGRGHDSVGRLEDARRLFAEAGAAEPAAEADHDLGRALIRLDRAEDARSPLERARAAFASLGSPKEAACLKDLGLVDLAAGEHEAALGPLTEARARFATTGDAAAVATCDLLVARAHRGSAARDAALAALDLAQAGFEGVGAQNRVLDCLVQRGQVLWEAGRLEEAATVHREAVDRMGDLSTPTATLVQLGLASLLASLDRRDESLAVYRSLRALAAERADHDSVVSCDLGIARNLRAMEDWDGAMAAIGAAREVVAGSASAQLADCAFEEAQILFATARYDRAEVAYAEALRGFGDLSKASARDAALLRAHALRRLGRHDEALDGYREARAAFVGRADRGRVASCDLGAGRTHRALGDTAGALGALDSAREGFASAGSTGEVLECLAERGHVLWDAGRREEALAAYREVGEQAGDLSSAQARDGMLSYSRALHSLGRYEEALAAYRELRTVHAERGDVERLAMCDLGIARAMRAAGDREGARAVVEEARAGFEAAGRADLVPECVLETAHAWYGDSRYEEALASYREVLALAGDLSTSQARDALINCGHALRFLGRHEESLAAYREVRAAYAERGDVEWVATCDLGIGRTMRVAGDREGARAAVEAARVGFEEAGQPDHVPECVLERAQVFFDEARYEDALASYREVLALVGDLSTTQARDALVNSGAALRLLGRYGEALEILHEARAVYTERGVGERVATCDLEIGRVLRAADDREGARAAVEQAVAGFEAAGRADRVPECVLETAHTLFSDGRWEEALASYREVLALVGDLSTAQARDALLNSAHMLRRLGRHADALAAYQGARAAYAERGTGDLVAACDLGWARSLFSLGRLRDAPVHYEHALAAYEAVGDERGAAQSASGLGWVLARLGRGDAALTALERARDLYATLGDVRAVADCDLNLAGVLQGQVQIDAARDALVRARAGFEQAGDDGGVAQCGIQLSLVHLAMGELEEAGDTLDRVGAALGRLPSGAQRGRYLLWLGKVQVARGRVDEGTRVLEDARADLLGAGDDEAVALAGTHLAEAYLLGKRFAEALETIDEAPSPEAESPLLQVLRSSVRAKALYMLDRDGEAMEVAQRAVATFREYGYGAAAAELEEQVAEIWLGRVDVDLPWSERVDRALEVIVPASTELGSVRYGLRSAADRERWARQTESSLGLAMALADESGDARLVADLVEATINRGVHTTVARAGSGKGVGARFAGSAGPVGVPAAPWGAGIAPRDLDDEAGERGVGLGDALDVGLGVDVAEDGVPALAMAGAVRLLDPTRLRLDPPPALLAPYDHVVLGRFRAPGEDEVTLRVW